MDYSKDKFWAGFLFCDQMFHWTNTQVHSQKKQFKKLVFVLNERQTEKTKVWAGFQSHVGVEGRGLTDGGEFHRLLNFFVA